jgi:hypothetical protein
VVAGGAMGPRPRCRSGSPSHATASTARSTPRWGGKVLTNVARGDDWAEAVAIQANGKIADAGSRAAGAGSLSPATWADDGGGGGGTTSVGPRLLRHAPRLTRHGVLTRGPRSSDGRGPHRLNVFRASRLPGRRGCDASGTSGHPRVTFPALRSAHGQGEHPLGPGERRGGASRAAARGQPALRDDRPAPRGRERR